MLAGLGRNPIVEFIFRHQRERHALYNYGMSRNGCGHILRLDALRVEDLADRVSDLRSVHDRAVYHGVLRQRFHPKAHELVTRLRRFQLDRFDGAGSDVQSHELSAPFAQSQHIAAPFLASVPVAHASLTAPCRRLAHLAFHPAVQDRFTQFPTISKFECGNFALRDVTVQGIRGDAQILRRLSYVHHFARFTHEERHPGIQLQACNHDRLLHPTCAADFQRGAARGSFMTLCTPSVKGIYRAVAL